MITLLEWANQVVRPPDTTIADRIAELTTINGGNIEITQVGNVKIDAAANRYGRTGLVPQEAMELAYLSGQLQILTLYHQGEIARFQNLIHLRVEGKPATGLIEVCSQDHLNQLLKKQR